MSVNSTIFAQATPQGKGCLCIIRLSGPDCFQILSKIVDEPTGLKIAAAKGWQVVYGNIVDQDNNLVDMVVFSIFRAPKSFTGEDVVEICCHNNKIIINKIFGLLIKNGAEYAKPGEFSLRAFFNKKIDLTQAEAIADLIAAQNQQAVERSLAQVGGSLSKFIEDLSSKYLHLIVLLEAYFEFMEEERLDISIEDRIAQGLEQIFVALEKIKASFKNKNIIKDGCRVAIIGPANAGKSTLFNNIIQKNKAIVSDIEGTTRDVVESFLDDDNFSFTLLDTAGIRKTSDVIEKIGIEKSLEEALLADVCLIVVDASKEKKDFELFEEFIKSHRDKIVFVMNKKDLGVLESWKTFAQSFADVAIISGSLDQDVSALKNLLTKKIERVLNVGSTPFLLNTRQELLLKQVYEKSLLLHQMLQDQVGFEVMVVYLKEIVEELMQLTGKNLEEKVLSEIFLSFCIGK